MTQFAVLWYRDSQSLPFYVYNTDRDSHYVSRESEGWHHQLNNNVFYLGEALLSFVKTQKMIYEWR